MLVDVLYQNLQMFGGGFGVYTDDNGVHIPKLEWAKHDSKMIAYIIRVDIDCQIIIDEREASAPHLRNVIHIVDDLYLVTKEIPNAG